MSVRTIFFITITLALLPTPELGAEEQSSRQLSRMWFGGSTAALPSFLLDSLFETSHTIYTGDTGIRYSSGREDNETSFSFAIGTFLTGGKIWRGNNSSPQEAFRADLDMHYYSVSVGKEWGKALGKNLSLRYGLGIGVAVFAGDIYTTEVIPGCEEPVSSCAHWNSVTREPVEFSSRFLPLLDLHLGLRCDLSGTLALQLDCGLRDLPYLAVYLGSKRTKK